MKPVASMVGVAVVALLAAGCAGSSGGNDVPGTSPTAGTTINSFSPAPQTTYRGSYVPLPDGSVPPATVDPDPAGPMYVLDAQSAFGTLGPCHDPLNQWTASTGTVTVFIYSLQPARGVTYSLTVTIDGGMTQTGTIEQGQDTHVFEFPGVDPASVKQVVVTAADAADGAKGGSCIVPGSATN